MKNIVIYDLSGIQKFIFSNSKLKTTVGASHLVHKALFENIPELEQTGKEAWKDDKSIAEAGTHIVYIGGGNAVLVFNSIEEEKAFTSKLTKKIICDAGGAIRLISASIQFDDTEKLPDVMKHLHEKLTAEKQKAVFSAPASGFSITAEDNETFDPVILVEPGKYCPRGKYLKLKAYEEVKEEKNSHIKFTDNFEKFSQDGKNFIAVIHIDGNTMGQCVRDYTDSLTGNINDEFLKLRELSLEISKVYNDVLEASINSLYENYTGDKTKDFPLRKIISDGDDVTIICKAELAMPFVKTFMDKLSEIDEIREKKLSAAAGVAFVGVKFPYYDAYKIAESLVKNAKKETLKRDFKGCSSVDWQIMYGGIADDVINFRKANYEIDGVNLTMRPLVFNNSDYSYETFLNKQQTIQEALAADFSRGKLKSLRNAYGVGKDEAKKYCEFIKERETKKGEESDGFKFAENLANVFEETDGETYATWFDVLDLMDFTLFSENSEGENNEVQIEN